jgi:hypothetical protein
MTTAASGISVSGAWSVDDMRAKQAGRWICGKRPMVSGVP